MKISLDRIILYVQEVRLLTDFYRTVFGLTLVEEIPDEWAVLKAGPCELALHRAGPAFRGSGKRSTTENSNAKLVLHVEGDLAALREQLVARGIAMSEIKSYPGFTGPLSDGRDPEGNVFQIAQA